MKAVHPNMNGHVEGISSPVGRVTSACSFVPRPLLHRVVQAAVLRCREWSYRHE